VEILLSAPTIASSYGNQSEAGSEGQGHKDVSNVYMVRDREHICDLHLSSASLCPGRDVEVHLDFNDSRQPCSMVRATVVLSEVRPDGSRIQVLLCAMLFANGKFGSHVQRVFLALGFSRTRSLTKRSVPPQTPNT